MLIVWGCCTFTVRQFMALGCPGWVSFCLRDLRCWPCNRKNRDKKWHQKYLEKRSAWHAVKSWVRCLSMSMVVDVRAGLNDQIYLKYTLVHVFSLCWLICLCFLTTVGPVKKNSIDLALHSYNSVGTKMDSLKKERNLNWCSRTIIHAF